VDTVVVEAANNTEIEVVVIDRDLIVSKEEDKEEVEKTEEEMLHQEYVEITTILAIVDLVTAANSDMKKLEVVEEEEVETKAMEETEVEAEVEVEVTLIKDQIEHQMLLQDNPYHFKSIIIK